MLTFTRGWIWPVAFTVWVMLRCSAFSTKTFTRLPSRLPRMLKATSATSARAPPAMRRMRFTELGLAVDSASEQSRQRDLAGDEQCPERQDDAPGGAAADPGHDPIAGGEKADRPDAENVEAAQERLQGASGILGHQARDRGEARFEKAAAAHLLHVDRAARQDDRNRKQRHHRERQEGVHHDRQAVAEFEVAAEHAEESQEDGRDEQVNRRLDEEL